MKHLVPATLIILLLTIAVGRWCARRSLALLTVEQKARLLDTSSTGNVWPLACLAFAVAMITWFPPRFIPISYLPGFIGAFFLSLFLISVGATVISVIRMSRLGLPQTYVRDTTLRAALYLIALLLFICAVILDGSAYIRRREHAAQSSNQAMQRTAPRSDA